MTHKTFGPVVSRHESRLGVVFDSDTHRLVVDFSRAQLRLFRKADTSPFLRTIKVIDIKDIQV